jgi:hypothetical protein
MCSVFKLMKSAGLTDFVYVHTAWLYKQVSANRSPPPFHPPGVRRTSGTIRPTPTPSGDCPPLLTSGSLCASTIAGRKWVTALFGISFNLEHCVKICRRVANVGFTSLCVMPRNASSMAEEEILQMARRESANNLSTRI